MINKGSVRRINSCLCNYIELNNQKNKRPIKSVFMNHHEITQFYKDMKAEIQNNNILDQVSQDRVYKNNKRAKSVIDHTRKVIKWEKSPTIQMISCGELLRNQKSFSKVKSKQSRPTQAAEPMNKQIQAEIKILRKFQQQKFIKKINNIKGNKNQSEIAQYKQYKHNLQQQRIALACRKSTRIFNNRINQKNNKQKKAIKVKQNKNKKIILQAIGQYFIKKNRYPMFES